MLQLQRVAACCSVLQCVAACCCWLQCVVVSYIAVSYVGDSVDVAACCSVLQCVAACCSVLQLQCDAVSYVGDSDRNVRRAAICCSCSVLQNMVSFLGLFYKRDL